MSMEFVFHQIIRNFEITKFIWFFFLQRTPEELYLDYHFSNLAGAI